MAVYFNNFPNTTHSGKLLKAITRRVDFRQTVFVDPYAFLPYTVTGDDRPEDIALFYYGDMKYTWLVYLSNRIIDPYHQWPMNSRNFEKYIIKKYAEQANTTGYSVIAWTQNTEITDNIIHYRNLSDPEFIISKDTYTLSENIVTSEWEVVRYYDYENELNESRRTINLIEDTYAKQAEKELRALLNYDIR